MTLAIRLWGLVGLGLLISTRPALAQEALPGDPARAEQLRQMIEDRFAERLVIELGLTDEQAGKVRGVLSNWSGKRRVLEKDERKFRQQLAAEMRPGVAANETTVNRLVDGVLDARLAYVQTFKDELKDLTGILNPIQRAQYVLLRDKLIQRVQEIRNQRQQDDEAGPLRRRRLRP